MRLKVWHIGVALTVSTTLTNQGAGSVGTSYTGLYLSTDATITTADIRIGLTSFGNLDSGTSSSGGTSVILSSLLTPGTYYLGAIADYSGSRPETDETNNAKAGNTIAIK